MITGFFLAAKDFILFPVIKNNERRTYEYNEENNCFCVYGVTSTGMCIKRQEGGKRDETAGQLRYSRG